MSHDYSSSQPHWYGTVAEHGPELLPPVSADAHRFVGEYVRHKYEGTPEQKARAAEERRQRKERAQAAIPAAQEWWHSMSAEAIGRLVMDAVLDLHMPLTGQWVHQLECAHCDMHWPCNTITAVADAVGLPVPDNIHLLTPAQLFGKDT
jgi:hypothetical protein